MNSADLRKQLDDLSTKLRSFRFGLLGGKNKNVKEGSVLKKEIARILTVISGRK